MIVPEIIWATTQAEFVVTKKSPRSLPTSFDLENSSIKISKVAIIKLPEAKYKINAKITRMPWLKKESAKSDNKHMLPKIKVAYLLPVYRRSFGISKRPIIVTIEDITYINPT